MWRSWKTKNNKTFGAIRFHICWLAIGIVNTKLHSFFLYWHFNAFTAYIAIMGWFFSFLKRPLMKYYLPEILLWNRKWIIQRWTHNMGQARFTEIPASTKSILTLVLSFPGVWYRKSPSFLFDSKPIHA